MVAMERVLAAAALLFLAPVIIAAPPGLDNQGGPFPPPVLYRGLGSQFVNGNDNVWQGPTADMTDPAKENASVILSVRGITSLVFLNATLQVPQ